jgi:hypothetical protein
MSSSLSKETPHMSTAVAIAQTLVRKERNRGATSEAARRWLATKLSVGEGTVRSLVRGTVKRVDETIRDRLRALLMRELEAEIARLQHELECLKAGGYHLASYEISEVETHLARAKAILTGQAHG